jgi:hypothetical protein
VATAAAVHQASGIIIIIIIIIINFCTLPSHEVCGRHAVQLAVQLLTMAISSLRTRKSRHQETSVIIGVNAIIPCCIIASSRHHNYYTHLHHFVQPVAEPGRAQQLIA